MATAARTKIPMPTPRRAAQLVSSAAARRTRPTGLLVGPAPEPGRLAGASRPDLSANLLRLAAL